MTSGLLWRGSLLPLGCEAAPSLSEKKGTATQSSGSKPPRHRSPDTNITRIKKIRGVACPS
ncbi:hypothetical protein C1Y11_09095 [Pseudomonas sp. FW305-20]|nr:hypothetical protein C1Y11_09095 [Pseudomonas sp. FW305-20]